MTRRLPWTRRPAAPPEPRSYLPSLDLLLQVAMQERDKQLAHFDGLDTKAGGLLAFDGVLIVVSRGIRLAFQLPGIVLASASAVLALAAFWPRKFPTIEPMALRQFLAYEEDKTRLKLHDTIATTVLQGGQVLRTKVRSLKLALILLLFAALTFGTGIIVTANSANPGRTQHGTGEPARTRASASPAPSASPS